MVRVPGQRKRTTPKAEALTPGRPAKSRLQQILVHFGQFLTAMRNNEQVVGERSGSQPAAPSP